MNVLNKQIVPARLLIKILLFFLLYVIYITAGPASVSGIVVSYLPIVLLLISIYLSLCEFFHREPNIQGCFLSSVLRIHSHELTPWLLIALLLIGSQMVLIWSGEVRSFFYMGGLLPNGDASSYYKGARRLLTEGELSEWSSRRPFMTAYLASVLAITKFSLSATVATISAIAAFSVALFASSLRRSESLGVVLWAFVLVFFFYYRFVGTTLSENLGLTFGSIAFVFLWLAANERSIRFFLVGVLFMALAQVTRSGAVFVLPALILWGTFWLGSGFRQRFLVFLGGCVAVLLGFFLNRLLLELGGSGGATGFSNFSYTVYGLSVGDGGWSQIKKDHPDIVALIEPARSQGIYALAFENILKQPSMLGEALLRNFHLYAFANGGLNIITGSKAWLLVQIPTVLGVIWCIRHIKTPRYALLLFVFSGVLLSSTIITEDGGLRVFAATIPFSAAIAAVGLQFFARHRDRKTRLNEYEGRNLILLTMFLGGVLVFGVFATMLVAPVKSATQTIQNKSCSAGLRVITISYPAHTAIHLRKKEQGYSHYVPDIPVKGFRESLKVNGHRRDWPIVDLLDIPYSMLSVGKYVLVPSEKIKDDPQVLSFCVKRHGWLFISEELLSNYTGDVRKE